jgi:phage terminase large subunit-like protein
MVFDARGNPRKVLALGPEVMCDREVTFCGGESVVTHDDHEWSVFWPESAPLHRIETRELPALIRDAMAKGQRVSVPIASPVTGIQLDLPCDPYLIGLWLGDGSTNQAHLTIGAQDLAATAENVKVAGGWLRPYPSKLKYLLWAPGGKVRKNGRPNAFLDALEYLGIRHHKAIPELLLIASVQQRLALLQGLMDTDGTIANGGEFKSPSFVTTSPDLAAGFRVLASSLGYKVHEYRDRAKLYGKDCGPCWTFSINGPLPPFRLPRKAAAVRGLAKRATRRAVLSVKPVVSRPGRCIEVEGGTYLVTRDHIPTHNSLLGAGLALHGLCGDGENGAQVYSAAGDREQAKIVFREAVSMVAMSPELSRILQVREGYNEIRHLASRSWYRALSAEAYTAEGLNPSRVIFDEVHVQPDHRLWDVMTLGSATREQPFILGITTAGYDKETLCGRMYDAGRMVERIGEQPKTYFSWYEAPHELDWRALETAATCNPGLGDFLLPEGILDEQNNGENAYRRYRLNQWTSSIDAWLPSGLWDTLATDRKLQPGENIVLAIDGSFNDDSTALIACTRDQFISVIGIWERPEGAGDDWKVPIAMVEQAIRDACTRYEVSEVVYDPYRWERTAQALEYEGIPMVMFPQSNERMVPATQEFQTAVIRDKVITHDGNPRLARHIENCRVRATPRGAKLTKESKGSPNKIDAAVAAVMAHSRSKELPTDKWNVY